MSYIINGFVLNNESILLTQNSILNLFSGAVSMTVCILCQTDSVDQSLLATISMLMSLD